MAISKATGELYAANHGDRDILAYSSTASGSQGPDRVITSQHPPLIRPAGVALNGSVLYSTSGATFTGRRRSSSSMHSKDGRLQSKS